MTIVDIIKAYINMLLGQDNKGSLTISYRVMRAIVRKWPEYCDHFISKSEYWSSQDHLEACLPNGAKLVKTKKKGRAVYLIYGYHYSGADIMKVLQSI
jgi:hypothetical protein